MTQFVGSIEAGGTKFVLGVQNVESGETVATKRVPTTTPAETLEACRDFFKENPVNALAIGSLAPSTSTRTPRLLATLPRRQSQVGPTLS